MGGLTITPNLSVHTGRSQGPGHAAPAADSLDGSERLRGDGGVVGGTPPSTGARALRQPLRRPADVWSPSLPADCALPSVSVTLATVV